MNIQFKKLIEPTPTVIEAFNRWENDANLIPLTRPNRNQSDLERRITLTPNEIKKRLEHHIIYLIYLNDKLIGEMNYMVEPSHLYKYELGTAWIAITIGEPEGRGKGIGFQALHYLEDQIKMNGLTRIELGMFEFNKQAIQLYQKLGYKEIGQIENFTFWKDRLWRDIRMEKYL